MRLRPQAYLSNLTGVSRGASLFDRFAAWVCDASHRDGTLVTEQELSDRFQVSRTPMREVLQQAQMIGLIRREPNRSIEIPALTVEHMQDLSVTREHLEALITTAVTARYGAGEVSLDGLERINRRMRALAKAGEADLLLEAGLEFHAEMSLLAGNPVAAHLLDQVLVCLERYRQLVDGESERAGQIAAEHETILASIKNAKPDEAARAARRHIANARAFYTEALGAKTAARAAGKATPKRPAASQTRARPRGAPAVPAEG